MKLKTLLSHLTVAAICITAYAADESAKGNEVDPAKVPEAPKDSSPPHRKSVNVPQIGQPAPEISAKEWINLKDPLRLADLRGKVVVLEFWATWCGPCIDGIPHLNELQRKRAGKDFQLLTFVQEGHQTIDRFLQRNHIEYAIGLASTTQADYGIRGIPHAFVIDREGKVVWHGHPEASGLEQAIATALNTGK